MNPVIDSLATLKQLQFNLVNIDGGEQAEISKQLNVEAFPTFIIYKGKKKFGKHLALLKQKLWHYA